MRIKDVGTQVRMNLGRVIRRVRIEKGISQEELSREVGITRTFLSLIENGERFPSYNTFSNIVHCLGKDPSSLIVEAELDSYDEDFKLVSFLTKLIESKDAEKLKKIVDFAKSLDQS